MPDKTERYSRRFGRAGLAEGRYQPFTRLAVVDAAVFFVVATVFRNGLIDWDEVPPQAEPSYEIWLRYLASRDGGAAYYLPERLARYRVHAGSGTDLRFEYQAVWMYDQMLLDDRLSDLRDDLSRASAPFRASLGISLLAQGRTAEARPYLWRGFSTGARLRAGAGLAISLLPPSMRAVAIERIRSNRRRRRVRSGVHRRHVNPRDTEAVM